MIPRIPAELVEEVIDILALSPEDSESGDNANSILSAITLVARICRRRTNTHRFSKLALYIHGTPTDRLQALAALMKSDVWQPNEGIAHCVRSLTLMLGRHLELINPLLHGKPRDESITSILNLIFRGNESGTYTEAAYSLTFGSDQYHDHNFVMLSANVVAALRDLCCDSHMSQLTLKRVKNVPSTLIFSSNITRLSLQSVSFTPSDTPAHITEPPLRNLKDLDLKLSPSFLDDVLGSHDPSLDVFKYMLRENDGFHVLSRLGRLLSRFTIELYEERDVPRFAIDNSQFNGLQFMRIETVYRPLVFGEKILAKQRDLEENDDTRQPPRPPFFLSVLNLLPPVSPSVLELHLTVYIEYYPHPDFPFEGLDHVYSRLYHESLVEYLEVSCTQQSTRTTIILQIYFDMRADIDYDPEVFREECMMYMRQLLARVDGIEGVTLDLNVRSFLDEIGENGSLFW